MAWLLAILGGCGSTVIGGDGAGGGEPPGPPELLPGDTGPSWEACLEPAPLRFNEVVAANLNGLTDGDGDTSDWFELAPVGGAVELSGWSLSEDAEDLFPLPELTLDAPLLVFASGKAASPSGELHTPFALDALGGELFLHGPDGCVAEVLDRPRQYADTAYGRNAEGDWAWFLEPSPGAENTTESRPGFAEPPTFDPAGGLHTAGAPVTVLGSGLLVYTLDGNVPTAASAEVSGPIPLPDADVVSLRAVSIVEGLWPSRPATATYLQDPDRFEPGVRVISMTFAPSDFFDPIDGIYEYGPDAEPGYPYFGANFWEVVEKAIHVEVFGPDGTRIVDQDAGVQIAGGYSRAFDQRNFELIARTAYGPATFAAPLFADEPYSDYPRLYLRNGGDWCSTQLVDATVQSLFRTAEGLRAPSIDAQAYEPALVYLNGDFWGVYELKERLDGDWAARHHGVDPENLDFVKLGWTHDANWTLESGDWEAFEVLNALAASGDLSRTSDYDDFEALVDVDNFIGAVVAQGWIGNSDWWGNNLRIWRPREEGGRFRWMVYDFGHGWTSWNYDHLATSVSGNWTGLPIGAALTNSTFRDRFVNVHADWLNTSLQGELARARLEALAAEVRPVMAEQRVRWCGGANMSAWESAVEYAADFAERRGGAVESSLRSALNPGAPHTLSLVASPASSGSFELAVVSVESGFSGTYYAGVPVEITAIPGPGATFAGWSDGEPSATRSVTLSEDLELEARFE